MPTFGWIVQALRHREPALQHLDGPARAMLATQHDAQPRKRLDGARVRAAVERLASLEHVP